MPTRLSAYRLWMIACVVALTTPAMSAEIADRPTPTVDFLEFNCLDCHEGSGAEAGLDLSQLGDDLADDVTRHRWVRIFDRVASGEMPPEDYGEVDSEEKMAFLDATGSWIREKQQEEYERRGRVRGRRLTNRQLENTLHDLLSIDVPLARLMPAEQRVEGFTGVVEAQSMSHFHLETHLRIIDAALDAAFDRAAEVEEDWERHFTPEDLARENPKRRCRDPEMRKGLAVVWSAGLAYYGRISSSRVDESGWYRIRFKASAVKKPDDHGVWCTVRSGRCVSSAPILNWIGSFEAENEAKELTYTAWIDEGDMLEIRPGDRTLKRGRFKGGQVGVGEGEPQDLPGLALHQMTMQEIHPGGTVDDVRRTLFGDLAVEVSPDDGPLRFVHNVTEDELAQQVTRFAEQAFRRPIDADHVQPYHALMRRFLDSGKSPVQALRSTYRALLCSPRFLYFHEQPGQLDNFAIANRLSYFFWNTMPDQELWHLAEEGELDDAAVLHRQVERMLAGERGKDFVKDFTSEWLDLSEINSTQLDRKFRNFDPVVQNAMLSETRTFIHDLLENDGSVVNLIDADYTYLNSRLARYYDVSFDGSDQLTRVELEPDCHRGGLLAHGAILKVTANGSNTSPVLRGVWVSERLLGKTIPPPPANVPAIEPDTRGAKTIREMLALHKSDPGCASCHKDIDPPGFALENFDAAGRWRDRYRDGKSKAGEIDASYELPDGREFEDFDQFRGLVAADPAPLARNVAEKLLVYGTGAPIEFAERELVEQLVARTADDEYGLRSIVHEVVSSPIFLSK